MTSSNNLDALFADAELPFGHPGHDFDETPEHFDRRDDRYEPPPVHPPEEAVVHYRARRSTPLRQRIARSPSTPTNLTRWPAAEDCLELVAEDLQDPDTQHGGYCLHCRQEITATGSVEWRRVVRRPCPHCGKAGW